MKTILALLLMALPAMGGELFMALTAYNTFDLESDYSNEVSLDSSEVGGKTLIWDPNTEPDLAGYRVHVGTSSGSYTKTIDLGPGNSWEIDLRPESPKNLRVIVTAQTSLDGENWEDMEDWEFEDERRFFRFQFEKVVVNEQ